MTRTARALATLVAASLLVAVGAVAAGAAVPAKEVSNEKYAKTTCKALLSVNSEIETVSDDYNALPVDDPATFQTQAGDLFDGFLAKLQADQKKLKKLSPEDGGKGVTKLFDKYYKELTTKLGDAITEFRAADPAGVAFQADVTIMQTAFNTLTVGASDPFSDIEAQDLLGAFDDEKSCEDVVTIFGA